VSFVEKAKYALTAQIYISHTTIVNYDVHIFKKEFLWKPWTPLNLPMLGQQWVVLWGQVWTWGITRNFNRTCGLCKGVILYRSGLCNMVAIMSSLESKLLCSFAQRWSFKRWSLIKGFTLIYMYIYIWMFPFSFPIVPPHDIVTLLMAIGSLDGSNVLLCQGENTSVKLKKSTFIYHVI